MSFRSLVTLYTTNLMNVGCCKKATLFLNRGAEHGGFGFWTRDAMADNGQLKRVIDPPHFPTNASLNERNKRANI